MSDGGLRCLAEQAVDEGDADIGHGIMLLCWFIEDPREPGDPGFEGEQAYGVCGTPDDATCRNCLDSVTQPVS